MYRTTKIFVKEETRLGRYFADMSGKTNNLYNVCMFYTRQVMTGVKKTVKTENEQHVFDVIAQALPEINKIKEQTYKNKLAKGEHPTSPQYRTFPTEEKWFLNWSYLADILKVSNNVDYYALPGQVNTAILRKVNKNWKSYFELQKRWNQDPSSLTGKPSLPHYRKSGGRFDIFFTNQNCKIKETGNRFVLTFPCSGGLTLNVGTYLTTKDKVSDVKVKPVFGGFEVNIATEMEDVDCTYQEPTRICSIDFGVDNFATISNNVGLSPCIVKGKDLKSKNQWFNKCISQLKGILAKVNKGKKTSKRIRRLYARRERYFHHRFHRISNVLVDYFVCNQIDTVVVGKNDGWKQNSNMSKVNNQNFQHIAYAWFLKLLAYKCEEAGVKLIQREESYTSKASFFDMDDIPTYGEKAVVPTFSGKRIQRGLYRTSNGRLINADINGASNILRKEFPHAFDKVGSYKYLLNPEILSIDKKEKYSKDCS